MDRYFAIDFENVRVEHHHLSDRNLVPDHVAVLILSALLVERCHKHYGASVGIGSNFDLPILVFNVSILGKFMDLDVFFRIIHVFDVLLNFFLVISDIILKDEVNESMAHGCLSKNKLKFAVGIQFD